MLSSTLVLQRMVDVCCRYVHVRACITAAVFVLFLAIVYNQEYGSSFDLGSKLVHTLIYHFRHIDYCLSSKYCTSVSSPLSKY